MKQRITIAQWGVFERENPTQAIKLCDRYFEWQEDQKQTAFPNSFVYATFPPIADWLTIGRMIEFLEEKALIVSNCLKQFHENKEKWHVAFSEDRKKAIKEEDFFNGSELCDCLWEAVKFELKRQT